MGMADVNFVDATILFPLQKLVEMFDPTALNFDDELAFFALEFVQFFYRDFWKF